MMIKSSIVSILARTGKAGEIAYVSISHNGAIKKINLWGPFKVGETIYVESKRLINV